VHLIEGRAASAVVATFNDSDIEVSADNFRATINWGDGTSSPGIITETPTQPPPLTSPGGFVGGQDVFQESAADFAGTVSGRHRYAEEGLYPITVTIHDAMDERDATAMSTAVVADAPLGGPVGFALCGVETRPLVNVPVAAFTDTGASEPGSNYTASINWGDGTPASPGIVLSGNGVLTVLGSHTYTAEGNFPVHVSIRDDGGSTSQARTVATIGGFVTSVYQELLGRLPDAPGLRVWEQQLQAGVSRAQVAEQIWLSAEHRGREVDQFYQTFLHHRADPGGRAFWVNTLLSGASESDVAIALLTSAEYTARHPDAASYVIGLYTDVLSRAPSAGEVAFWTQVLQSGARSRAAVAYYFLSSPEAYLQALNNYYAEFLGRAPDAFGQGIFLAAMTNGSATPASIAGAFLGSPEYLDRVFARGCS
jgi:hypothetical protein